MYECSLFLSEISWQKCWIFFSFFEFSPAPSCLTWRRGSHLLDPGKLNQVSSWLVAHRPGGREDVLAHTSMYSHEMMAHSVRDKKATQACMTQTLARTMKTCEVFFFATSRQWGWMRRSTLNDIRGFHCTNVERVTPWHSTRTPKGPLQLSWGIYRVRRGHQ